MMFSHPSRKALPIITLLIVDFDNTLFDWFDFWYNSFSAMLEIVLEKTNLDRNSLLAEIRDVHRRHATTEYSWLLQELPSISRLPKIQRDDVIDEARIAFSRMRERRSHLYDDVQITLRKVKESGARLVGFTESQKFYTVQRVLRFGLDGVLDALYCREEHSTPQDVDLWQIRSKSADAYTTKITRIVEIDAKNRKPDPRILLQIARDYDAVLDQVLYVGDSKMKDVYMAQQAGIHDAHAEYGQSMDRAGYDLLRSVSSWSEEDIEREKSMAIEVVPSISLQSGLADIFKHFTFGSPEASEALH